MFLAQTSAPTTTPAASPVPPPDPAAQVHELMTSLGLHKTWTETTWKEWLILLGFIFVAVLAGKVVSEVFDTLANRLKRREAHATATVFRSGVRPISLFCLTLGLWAGLKPVAMEPSLRDITARCLTLLFTLSVGWFLFNLVDLMDHWLKSLASTTASHLDDQLAPLIRKTLRIFLCVLVALYIAQNVFEQNITTWLAGLGIAGLAVSLAAQDSIKNLFGSITIFLDKPFAVGDRILFDIFDGTVVEIGFRSTRIRTMAGEMATIPNAKFIDNAVRNVSARPNIPKTLEVLLPPDSPPGNVLKAISLIEQTLHEPGLTEGFDWKANPPRVAFEELRGEVRVIKVTYAFAPADLPAFLAHLQRLQLRLIDVLSKAGIAFTATKNA
jgi:MscS family membrane protein